MSLMGKSNPQINPQPLSYLTEPSITHSFMAGGIAGLMVDVTLFPLDTIKTRMQCDRGFMKAGGFSGIYKGIGPIAAGALPSAAVFFGVYTSVKQLAHHQSTLDLHPHYISMGAAIIGETVSLGVRLPFEVLKQRRQAQFYKAGSWTGFRNILSHEGFLGLYQGMGSTVLRDVPFAFVQFPLWEYLKEVWSEAQNGLTTPAEGAFCGAIAGAVAGAVTTPMDVIKTRIITNRTPSSNYLFICKLLWKESGVRGFFHGFIPRVTWIFLGGGVFFGVYEKMIAYLEPTQGKKPQKK